jgi:hypothetical protein
MKLKMRELAQIELEVTKEVEYMLNYSIQCFKLESPVQFVCQMIEDCYINQQISKTEDEYYLSINK